MKVRIRKRSARMISFLKKKIPSIFSKAFLIFLLVGSGVLFPLHPTFSENPSGDILPPYGNIYGQAKIFEEGAASPPTVLHPFSAEPYDPFEGINRIVFEFNRVIEGLLLNPLVHIYRGVVPPFFQKRIHNALTNLATPVYFLNDLLQLKIDHAGDSLARFVINSTLGLLGLFDVATDMGIPAHKDNFGTTLATWGADPGPYIVLPILGPTDLRGALGMVADFFADPFNYYAIHSHHEGLMDIRFGATYVDERSRLIIMLENLEKTSVDYYAALRSFYWQHKRALVLHDHEFADNEERSAALDSDHPQPEED